MPFTCVYNSNIEEPFRVLHAQPAVRSRRRRQRRWRWRQEKGSVSRVQHAVFVYNNNKTSIEFICSSMNFSHIYYAIQWPWRHVPTAFVVEIEMSTVLLANTPRVSGWWRSRGTGLVYIVIKICNTHKHAHNGWRKKM